MLISIDPFYIPNPECHLRNPGLSLEMEHFLSLSLMQTLDDYNRLLSNPKDVLSEIGSNDHYYHRHYTSSIFEWSPTFRLLKIAIQRGADKTSSDEDIIINGQYNEKSEAFGVTKKIFDEFYNAAIQNGSVPIILILPSFGDVLRNHMENEKRYSPLLSYFGSAGYRYIDLMDAFENAAVKDLFAGHYTPLANKLVAKYILSYLKKME